MGGVAYNNGLDKIKNSELWKDTQAILCKRYGADTERIENETFESVIRYLHARQAEKLCGSTPVWSGLVDTAPALLTP